VDRHALDFFILKKLKKICFALDSWSSAWCKNKKNIFYATFLILAVHF
jgi:hypothetical protein